MTVESIKRSIKKKFGSYSAFAKAAGVDRYELERDFLSKHKVPKLELAAIAQLVADTEPDLIGRPLQASEIKAIREAINESGGVDAFCEESGFSRNTVFQILAGRYRSITENVKKLMDYLKIEV